MSDAHFLNLKNNQVVFFGDIIGFSNIILASENVDFESKDTKGIIVNLPVIYNMITKGDFSKEYQSKLGIKFLWVSDSIVISAPITNIDNLLIALSNLINQLYCTGFAIRGALCVGKLYHEENIWGAPFVKAVRLEENVAKFPRIIISKTELSSLKISEQYKTYFKNTENDEYLYFDYFSSFFDKQVKENKNISSFLGVYTSFIIQSFEGSTNEEHRDKWRWLGKELQNVIITHLGYIQDMLDNDEIFSCFTGNKMVDGNEYLNVLEMLNKR